MPVRAYDAAFLHVATNSQLLAFCRRLFGESFVLLQQNGLFNRPTRAHYQLKWHRDLPFQDWVSSKPLAIAALLSLDEFNAITGGTYLLAGSHLHDGFQSEAFVRRHQHVMLAPPGTFVVYGCYGVSPRRQEFLRCRAPRREPSHRETVPGATNRHSEGIGGGPLRRRVSLPIPRL